MNWVMGCSLGQVNLPMRVSVFSCISLELSNSGALTLFRVGGK